MSLYEAIYTGFGDPSALVSAQPTAVHERGGEYAETPLHLVARGRGDRHLAQLLIANGADVNARNNLGLTPLHLAARFHQPDVVTLLINRGANVNGRSDAGESPLHGAAMSGWQDVVDLLLASGADVNLKDNDGETPADAAGKAAHTPMEQFLRKKAKKGWFS